MAHGLILFDDGFVTLRIFSLYTRLATIVEQEFCEVKVALLASGQVESGHSHLRYLMSRHHAHLSGIGTYLLAGNVGIAAGNIKELALARSLPIGDGPLNHVS